MWARAKQLPSLQIVNMAEPLATNDSARTLRSSHPRETSKDETQTMQFALMKMGDEIRCIVPAGDICGEGAVWHPGQNALYWTDINRFLVHRYDPGCHTTETWLFNEPVTAVNLTTDAKLLLLVVGSNIGLWSPRRTRRSSD
jgi:sugar lactone lactonase YvrE